MATLRNVRSAGHGIYLVDPEKLMEAAYKQVQGKKIGPGIPQKKEAYEQKPGKTMRPKSEPKHPQSELF